MTDLQLELTKIIGSKELSFGCYIQKNNHWSNSDKPVVWRVTSDSTNFETWYQMWFNAPYMGTYSTTIFWISVLNEIDEQGRKKWEIIGHPATLSDIEKWMESKWFEWEYGNKYTNQYGEAQIIIWWGNGIYLGNRFSYDPSKYLLDQSEETLKEIIDFIKANK